VTGKVDFVFLACPRTVLSARESFRETEDSFPFRKPFHPTNDAFATRTKMMRAPFAAFLLHNPLKIVTARNDTML